MKKIYLSDSGPKVSAAIYGFWRWEEGGDITTANIERVVNLCLELGINTFDHADYYGNNQLEEHFGRIIEQKSFKREDIVLFSKCGLRTSADGKMVYADNSASYILDSLDKSLKNLKTDYLDIFLLDQFDAVANPEETAVTLEQIVRTGKAKHIGVSNFTVFQHQLLSSYLTTPIVTNHIELNLTDITAIKDGRIDFIKQQFSKPLAFSPLAGGRILKGMDSKSLTIRSLLQEIGEKHNANSEQMAVAWLMKLGTIPIIGSLSSERITNAATASEIELSHEDWYRIYHAAQ
jgi:predicted oxidoreductase